MKKEEEREEKKGFSLRRKRDGERKMDRDTWREKA